LQRDGRRISSLDLFGRSFVLVAGRQGEALCAAARTFSGLGLDCHCIGESLHDPDDCFTRGYGLSSAGASLIRPDGFVGWRANRMAEDPRSAIGRALGALLAR
jgi:hypothetical protein